MAAETDDDVLLDELWEDGDGDRRSRRRRRRRRARRRRDAAGSELDGRPDAPAADDAPGSDEDALFGASPAVTDDDPSVDEGSAAPLELDDDPSDDPSIDSVDEDSAAPLELDDDPSDDSVDEDSVDGTAPVRRSRRSQGRRAALRRRRRRQAVLKGVGALVLVAGLAVGAIWAATNVDLGGGPDETPSAAAGAGGEDVAVDAQPTAILATFDESSVTQAATGIAVLAWDRDTDAATILLVPTGITTDLPGHGVGPLGDAYAIGEGPLLDAALDNLLSVDLDLTVGVSRQAWASLFTRVGGLTIDVPERLRQRNDDGSATVRFAAGEQYLDGPRVAELLTFSSSDERELEALPRVQLVLLSLLDAISAEPELLDTIFSDGAPMLDVGVADGAVDTLRVLFRELAEAQTRGDLVVRTLPVSPLGSGEADTYRLDEARATQLVDDRFGDSKPTITNVEGGRRLEIRNGNGVGGVSSEVAQTLIPLGFRVLLTGNADDFDHDTTRILVYDDSDAQLAVAREIRDALGVGRVEISEVPQDVVDVTIVVGSDYLDVRG